MIGQFSYMVTYGRLMGCSSLDLLQRCWLVGLGHMGPIPWESANDVSQDKEWQYDDVHFSCVYEAILHVGISEHIFHVGPHTRQPANQRD